MTFRRQRALALMLVVAGAGTFGVASNGLAGTDEQLRAISDPPAELRRVECPRNEQPDPEV